MKFGTVVLALAAMIQFADTSFAQCGCSPHYGSTSHYAPPMHYAPPAHYPPPISALPAPRPAPRGPASIAYVNRLATPVPRNNYTLNYAIHLTDGRILLSDFLPNGHTVRGIEMQSGEGGRRMRTTVGNSGSITVRDPANDQAVADFGRAGYVR